MRASRLMSILLTLQARGQVTADALAAEHEVSVRTIYRDVDALSASGVPVVSDRGPGGGFRLIDGYRTQLTGLTPEEATTVLLAGMPGPVADLGLDAALVSAERKILAALPPAHATGALHTRQRVLLDPLDWYRRVERPSVLPQIASALWTQHRLSVRYESWTSTTTQTLEPYGLVIKAGVWYLVARGRSSIKTYRVSQMRECTTLQDSFDVPADFQLARHWGESLARFERDRHTGTATIRVGPGGLSRVERLGADTAEALRAAVPDHHQWREAVVPIESIDHAALELLGLGPHVRVVAPAALRRRLGSLARQVLVGTRAIVRRSPGLRSKRP